MSLDPAFIATIEDDMVAQVQTNGTPDRRTPVPRNSKAHADAGNTA